MPDYMVSSLVGWPTLSVQINLCNKLCNHRLTAVLLQPSEALGFSQSALKQLNYVLVNVPNFGVHSLSGPVIFSAVQITAFIAKLENF